MPRAQVGEAGLAPDLEAEPEDHAAFGQTAGAALDHLLLQLEAGNAVDQQAASPVVAVVDGDGVAGLAQPFGRRQPRRARADDPHRGAAVGTGAQRLDPALLPRGVGDVFLDRADGHGAMARLLDDAVTLAQAVLRADAAADFREGVGGLA